MQQQTRPKGGREVKNGNGRGPVVGAIVTSAVSSLIAVGAAYQFWVMPMNREASREVAEDVVTKHDSVVRTELNWIKEGQQDNRAQIRAAIQRLEAIQAQLARLEALVK